MKIDKINEIGVNISEEIQSMFVVANPTIGKTEGNAKLSPTETAKAKAHGNPVATTQNADVPTVVNTNVVRPTTLMI
jgi:hypothetical protein